MAINKIVWDLEPHTEAKHRILKKYIEAWIPILSKFHRRLVYIDAFAGPGIYSKGEPGSPIIVINAAINNRTKNKFEFVCLAIEMDPPRYQSLKDEIDKLHLPDSIKINIDKGDSNLVLGNLLTKIEQKGTVLAPTFAFIDPFNYDVSFDLIKRLFQNKKCEIFISFMYNGIIRNIPNTTESEKLDRFFGTKEWRKANKMNGNSKKAFLHDLYMKQLHDLDRDGKKEETLVRSFEMIDQQNKTSYFLFYVTKNILGLAKMKEAMWNIDKTGNFVFSDNTDPRQTVLFTLDETNILENQIISHFRGKEISISEIEQFVVSKTAFLATHYKGVLKNLEEKGFLKSLTPRKKKLTYPPGTIIKIERYN